MPRRSLLSNEQRTRLFAVPVDHAEMAKHYVLSADDLVFVQQSGARSIGLGLPIVPNARYQVSGTSDQDRGRARGAGVGDGRV